MADLYFLIPLLTGFGFNLASAFTSTYARRWGEKAGSLITIIFRDILGIPVWAVGFALAANTPSPSLFATSRVTQGVGWSLIAIGGLVILAALLTLRLRAAAPTPGDTLAQNGLYAYVRHPIHTGTLLEFLGLFLVIPSLAIALACGVGILWVLVQTRFEEIDLQQRMPAYREYMHQVPRFLPRLWKR